MVLSLTFNFAVNDFLCDEKGKAQQSVSFLVG